MRTRNVNEEVIFTTDAAVGVGRSAIHTLKNLAQGNVRNRIRLCTHRNVDDSLHEMFIVHQKGTYVRPHKHLNKIESFHVIEGYIDLVVLDDQGKVIKVARMGDYGSGMPFYHRLSESQFHTLLIRSEVAVFHEVTGGPFQRSDTLFAPWSPEESDTASAKEYLAGMEALADRSFLDREFTGSIDGGLS